MRSVVFFCSFHPPHGILSPVDVFLKKTNKLHLLVINSGLICESSMFTLSVLISLSFTLCRESDGSNTGFKRNMRTPSWPFS